jgi:hypothetical protein
MELHQPELFRRQWAGFQQKCVRNSDLAHVVQPSRQPDDFDVALCESQLAGNGVRIFGYSQTMASGVDIMRVERLGQRFGQT